MDSSKNHYKTIDGYIQTFPKEVREILEMLRKTIKDEIPEVTEDISYNMPTFKLQGMSLIYFAAWKKHVSLYPFSSDMEHEIPEASKYNTSGKGTIQFPLNEPMPYSLIRKIVKFRIKEVEEK